MLSLKQPCKWETPHAIRCCCKNKAPVRLMFPEVSIVTALETVLERVFPELALLKESWSATCTRRGIWSAQSVFTVSMKNGRLGSAWTGRTRICSPISVFLVCFASFALISIALAILLCITQEYRRSIRSLLPFKANYDAVLLKIFLKSYQPRALCATPKQTWKVLIFQCVSLNIQGNYCFWFIIVQY